MNKRIVLIGVVLIVISIVLGAFGAHALKDILSSEKLSSFETGVRYEIYHGFGLLILGLNADRFLFNLKTTVYVMLAGVLLFSGSIYLLSLQEVLEVKLSFLGPVTPIGGVLLITSWIIIAVNLSRSN